MTGPLPAGASGGGLLLLDRPQEHPTRHLAGWISPQADAYGGYNGVYAAAHKPAPVRNAQC